MEGQTRHWPISLDSHPKALIMGIAHHGALARERYTLGDVWCIHFYRYHGRLRVRGEEFPIRPGFVSLTPPNIVLEHQFDQPRCTHAVAHFSLPPTGVCSYTIPVMQDRGQDFGRLSAEFEQAVGCFAFNPCRAEVRLWDILWQLSPSSLPDSAALRLHPAVQQALQTVELRLGEPLSVREIAREVDLSTSHLSRLFRSATGSTVVGYLLSRRVERARHLLTYSSLPVKTIAEQVGLPDLHQFNKTLRRALGAAPRAFREQAQSELSQNKVQ